MSAASVRASWSRIEAWLARHAPEVAAALRAPATAAEIQAAEAALGVRFPAEVAESFAVHDGQERHADCIFDGLEWLSLARVVEEWTVWKQLLDAGDLPGRNGETDGVTAPDWWRPEWIPLSYDGWGNHHCLDLHPGPNGRAGQIIFMWHDDARRPREALSYAEWLAAFAAGLESGVLVYSKESGAIVRADAAG